MRAPGVQRRQLRSCPGIQPMQQRTGEVRMRWSCPELREYENATLRPAPITSLKLPVAHARGQVARSNQPEVAQGPFAVSSDTHATPPTDGRGSVSSVTLTFLGRRLPTTRRPTARCRITRAAFKSRSHLSPQCSQACMRTLRLLGTKAPQREHSCVVYRASTSIRSTPSSDARNEYFNSQTEAWYRGSQAQRPGGARSPPRRELW